MPGLVRQGGMIWADTGADTAASRGVQVTSHASPNTYGSWTQLIASTSHDTDYMIVAAHYEVVSAVLRNFRFDIGFGSNPYYVLLDSVCLELKGDNNATTVMNLPIRVPSGAPIVARCMDSSGGSVLELNVSTFVSGRFSNPGYSKTIALGVTNSKGTNVDPGGVAHTKGSWSQISASTTEEIAEFVMFVTNDGDVTQQEYKWLVDVAVGAAGSEQIIVGDLFVAGTLYEVQKAPYRIPIMIPKNSRVAVRAQCDNTTDVDRDLAVSILGFVR